MAAPAGQVLRARAERAVQVERRDRAARADPAFLPGREQHDGPAEALDEPRGDDSDHAPMPVLAREHVAAAALRRLGPLANLRDRLAKDALLDGLAVAVQGLELAGEALRFGRVVGQEHLERGARMAEPSGGVDPRREPEAELAGLDRRRIDARGLHERAQPGTGRLGQAAQAGRDQVAVLVHERDDVGDRRQRDQVEPPLQVGGGERLEELPDDAGAAELLEWVVGRARRNDRAVRERLARPVMVGDDDAEPARLGGLDLGDGRDPAVHGEEKPAALVGEPFERLAGDAVALLEAAREVPVDVCAEVAQRGDRERGRADPVHVVVAVHADPASGGDRLADRVTGLLHRAEQERIVAGIGRAQERACLRRVSVPPPDEDARSRLAEVEGRRQGPHLSAGAGTDRPRALVHGIQSGGSVGRRPVHRPQAPAASICPGHPRRRQPAPRRAVLV